MPLTWDALGDEKAVNRWITEYFCDKLAHYEEPYSYMFSFLWRSQIYVGNSIDPATPGELPLGQTLR